MNKISHYLSLISIFIAGLLGFYIFSYDKFFQVGIATALSASYVAWGIIHHVIHKDISLSIILEYVAIAIFGIVITYSLIYSG